MSPEESHAFGIIDYCILGVVLSLSVLIGIYYSVKGIKTPEEYLVGNRRFGALPIGISLLVTYVSAESFLGYSGEAYANGIQLSLLVIGACFAIVAAGFLFLPVLFPLQLTSIFEYIELRFNSPRLRSCMTIFLHIQVTVFMGFVLFAPTIALESVTPISSFTYIFILGGICTFYATIGGMKAVVWTDVLQFSVIILGLTVVVAVGSNQAGGFGNVWSISAAGGRLNVFNLDQSFYDRPNIFSSIAFGFFQCLNAYGVLQANYQRMVSVATIKDAWKVLLFNFVGLPLICFLVFSGGLVAYASYAGCDPLLLGKIKRKEEILSFFVADRLKFITGLPGLFIATLTAGSLSTLSSTTNTQAAIIWKEISPKIKMLREATPATAALVNKFISLYFGLVVIGFAILVSTAGNIIRYSFTAFNVSNGAIFGVFFLGVLFPRCNLIGVWSGVLTSVGLVGWIAVGNVMYIQNQETLPFSTESCNETLFQNLTSLNSFQTTNTYDFRYNNSHNETAANYNEVGTDSSFILMNLYAINFTWYPFLGQAICIIVGIVVSYITGLEKLENTSEKYVSPYVRKFYWK